VEIINICHRVSLTIYLPLATQKASMPKAKWEPLMNNHIIMWKKDSEIFNTSVFGKPND
jgi:hypothetical protein